MLLIHGEIINTNFEDKYLNTLYQDFLNTLNQDNMLTKEKVINACDNLYKKVINGDFDDIIEPLLRMTDISK